MAEDVFGLVGTIQAGTFQVEQAVAEGGFGVVYRAHHTAFRAPVALKCLKVPETLTAADRRQFEDQFRAEAELLFQLSASTPTVVRPLQVGVASSRISEFIPFMALEWLEGQSLDEMIQERRERGEPPLSIEETVQLLRPVAFALDNAHRFPGPDGTVCILHRDMKPDNVFIADVRGQKAVRILDFGIAKVKSAATAVVGKASAQATSLAAFTPGYGAPEQWVPNRFGQTGPWTDVYGFALTVIETIAGRAPVEGDPAAMMGAALDEKLRPTPRNCGVQIPDAVEAVFVKALAVDPRDRYHSMSEFWQALEAAVEGGEQSREAVTRVEPVQGRQAPGAAAAPRGLSSHPPDPYGGTRLTGAGGSAAAAATSAIPDLVPEQPKPKPASAEAASATPAGATPPGQPQPSAPGWSGGAGAAGQLSISAIDEFDDMDIQRVGSPTSPTSSAETTAPSWLELDGVGIVPGAAQVAPPRQVRLAPASAKDMERREGSRAVSAVKERLRGPLILIALGSVVAAAGWAHQIVTGEVFVVGPLRPLFVAGPLVLFGMVLGVARLIFSD